MFKRHAIPSECRSCYTESMVRDTHFDVLIVGSGAAGLSLALQLPETHWLVVEVGFEFRLHLLGSGWNGRGITRARYD